MKPEESSEGNGIDAMKHLLPATVTITVLVCLVTFFFNFSRSGGATWNSTIRWKNIYLHCIDKCMSSSIFFFHPFCFFPSLCLIVPISFSCLGVVLAMLFSQILLTTLRSCNLWVSWHPSAQKISFATIFFMHNSVSIMFFSIRARTLYIFFIVITHAWL